MLRLCIPLDFQRGGVRQKKSYLINDSKTISTNTLRRLSKNTVKILLTAPVIKYLKLLHALMHIIMNLVTHTQIVAVLHLRIPWLLRQITIWNYNLLNNATTVIIGHYAKTNACVQYSTGDTRCRLDGNIHAPPTGN